MLAQSEHDEEATSFLITTEASHLESVPAAIEKEMETLSRTDIIRTALKNGARIIVARDIEEATTLSNLIGPEHLAIYTESPREVLKNITAAAAPQVGGQH